MLGLLFLIPLTDLYLLLILFSNLLLEFEINMYKSLKEKKLIQQDFWTNSLSLIVIGLICRYEWLHCALIIDVFLTEDATSTVWPFSEITYFDFSTNRENFNCLLCSHQSTQYTKVQSTAYLVISVIFCCWDVVCSLYISLSKYCYNKGWRYTFLTIF